MSTICCLGIISTSSVKIWIIDKVGACSLGSDYLQRNTLVWPDNQFLVYLFFYPSSCAMNSFAISSYNIPSILTSYQSGT